MPQDVITTLSDEQLESLEIFRLQQYTVNYHPVTKNPVITFHFKDIKALVKNVIQKFVEEQMVQYPPESMHADLIELQEKTAALKLRSVPTVSMRLTPGGSQDGASLDGPPAPPALAIEAQPTKNVPSPTE